MSQQPQHVWHDAERAPYMTYFQDGILDILLGIWIVLLGLSLLWQKAFFPALAAAILLPIAWDLKKWLVVPHLPNLHFDEQELKREQRRIQWIIGTLVFGLIAATLLYFWMKGQNIIITNWTAVLGLIVALGVGYVGYLYRAMNWAVYSFALFVAVWAAVGLNMPLGFCQSIVGLMIMLSGFGLLRSFWRSHPLTM